MQAGGGGGGRGVDFLQAVSYELSGQLETWSQTLQRRKALLLL